MHMKHFSKNLVHAIKRITFPRNSVRVCQDECLTPSNYTRFKSEPNVDHMTFGKVSDYVGYVHKIHRHC